MVCNFADWVIKREGGFVLVTLFFELLGLGEDSCHIVRLRLPANVFKLGSRALTQLQSSLQMTGAPTNSLTTTSWRNLSQPLS